jgi:hypothetical protein
VPCVYAQVLHATLYTKFELFKVQYCSILVPIKTVYKFHTCKAHDMCNIIYICMYACMHVCIYVCIGSYIHSLDIGPRWIMLNSFSSCLIVPEIAAK